MPAFQYTALTSQGQTARGQVTAEDRGAAIGAVEAMGLVPTDLQLVGHRDGGGGLLARWLGRGDEGAEGAAAVRGRVSQQQVLNFVRQLGNLLAAGVPLARALQILGRESSSAAAQRYWGQIRERVVDGMSLADAMAQQPKVFPAVYVAMVRAGEAGGFLDVVLKQIADFMARERDLKGKVGTALIYPAVLALIATGVVCFLLVWFIPRFSEIFSEFGQSLPLLTRIIQGASLLLLNYGLFVLGGVLILGMAIRQMLASEAGRRQRDAWVMRLPGVGQAASRFALVRFCRMLGTLVGAGVPLLSALRVARAAVGNQTLTDALGEAIDRVQEGEGLAKSLARCPTLFPPSVSEMVSVAEEGGRLSEELVRMASEFEDDLDRRLRVLVSLAEPALLFVMAVLVGAIVVGMLLPVFDLWDAIQ